MGRDSARAINHARIDAASRVRSGQRAAPKVHLAEPDFANRIADAIDARKVLGAMRRTTEYARAVADIERGIRAKTPPELATEFGIPEAEAERLVTVVQLNDKDGTRVDRRLTREQIEAAFPNPPRK